MNPALSMDRKDLGRKGGVKVLIASGGSGGHIFPAIALARTLEDKAGGIGIRFIGANKELDKRIFEKEGFSYSLLSANKLSYKPSFGLVIFFIKLLYDTIRAFFIIISYRPDVVVGFGGYVSCPVMLASGFLRIPRMLHEQNVSPGRANKFLFHLADRIAISFEETKDLLKADIRKTAFTGNPIRRELFRDDRDFAIKNFGFSKSKFTILVIGGSQGAHSLNDTFVKALNILPDDLKTGLQIIHITGVKDYEWALESYKSLRNIESRVYSFIDRIEEAYSASDLAVTRSGASAIFELAFFSKPMILVPYPFAMSHQAENADVFSKKGAAIKLEERILSAELFRDTLKGLLNDRGKLNKMAEAAKRLSAPEASERLAEETLLLAGA